MSNTTLISEQHLSTTQSFKGRTVISLSDGQRIGSVEDVLIQPEDFSIKGIITAKSGIFHSDEMVIRKDDVHLWGKDVIFASHPDVIHKKDDLPDLAESVPVTHYFPGRAVISLNGDRIGDLKDLLITAKGETAGIELAKISKEFLDQFQGKQDGNGTPWLPVSMVHSFGKDVVIVEMEPSKVQEDMPEREKQNA